MHSARIARDPQRYRDSSEHSFRDGNKRISFLAAVIFLGLNRLDVIAPEEEVVERMLALASGELDEEALATWIRSRTQPRPAV